MRTRTGAVHLALLTLLIGLLVGSVPAAAQATPADLFDPALVEAELAPGESLDIEKTLTLGTEVTKADILLVVKPDENMGNQIQTLQQGFGAATQQIAQSFPGGVNYATASYCDYDPSGQDPTVYPWRVEHDFTADTAVAQTALNALSDTCSVDDGNDGDRDALFRAMYESGTSEALSFRQEADVARIVLVAGNDIGYDQDINSIFDACENTDIDDPGPDAQPGTPDDITAESAVEALLASGRKMLFVNFGNGGARDCGNQIAEATGGSGLDGDDFSDFESIPGRVQEMANTINWVDLVVDPEDCPLQVGFNPEPLYGPVPVGERVTFTETVTAPAELAPGTYECSVFGVADGVQRAEQLLSITVAQGGETTTTAGETTTTAGETTTTAGETTTTLSTTPAGGTLPFTGSYTIPVLIGALLMLGGGVTAVVLMRRRREGEITS